MRFVTFEKNGKSAGGVLMDGNVSSLADILPGAGVESVLDLINSGSDSLKELQKAVYSGRGEWLALESVELNAPIPRPAKNIICVGKNYAEHATEFHVSGFDSSKQGEELPGYPIIFTKSPTSVIAHNAEIDSSMDSTNSIDYEGELAIVIGKKAKGVSEDEAYDHIFGYTLVNDVTSRITQKNHNQWFLGKSPDTFCPMGPSILTADEIADVEGLELRTLVNGEVRQKAKVRDLIFKIPELIETISKTITLEPGDIIATGTPVGVGIGFNPPSIWLRVTP